MAGGVAGWDGLWPCLGLSAHPQCTCVWVYSPKSSCLKLADRVSFVQNNLFPFSPWQQVCPFAASLSSVTAWDSMGA